MLDKVAAKLNFIPYSSKKDLREGAILRFKDGTLMLVGAVNLRLGVCNCCSAGDEDEIREIAYLDQLILD